MIASLTRRTALAAATVGAIACRPHRDTSPTPTSAPAGSTSSSTPFVDSGGVIPGECDARVLDFAESPVGPERALVLVPHAVLAPGAVPVLVALHGRGEAVRGLEVGARAWADDYRLVRALARLAAPPLTAEDFEGLIARERLLRINASLVERPYRGLVVVCPWVPDLLTERERGRLDSANAFGQFLIERLLPAVVAAVPAASSAREATGIDGVSLGGRVALLAGFAHADRFGAVGSLQAAIQRAEVPAIVERVQRAVQGAGAMRLRLVTSERDYFRGAIGNLHEALTEAHVDHEHLLLLGPHDYVWNRGPGGIEMLLWHDRVLRGEEPV